MSSFYDFGFNGDICDLLDDNEDLNSDFSSSHYPVKDERYKLIESRGDWELYEFKITRDRSWCSVALIKEHGIGFAFYDPDVDPMWQPPIPSEQDTFVF